MALAEVMDAMRESLQRSLDELISPRAALKSKMQALRSLECALAQACFAPAQDGSSLVKDAFMALQYTFQCNVPAHLLSWVMAATARLEAALSRSAGDDRDGRAAELADELVVQLSLALSLIQGVTLNHEASKHYLGRRSALEILLDLLLVSRHVGAAASQSSSDSTHGSSSSSSSTTTSTTSTPLTSIVLDTLLCILVDSSKALRAFEEANGVQSIVKILKRAGTPREVRMKCLEFLYFYLLDETPSLDTAPASAPAAPRQSPKEPIPTPPPTAPVTPARRAKPYLSATPMRPSGASASRHGSSSSSSSSSLAFSLISSPGAGSNPNSSVGTPAAALSTSASSTSSSRSTSGSSTSNHSFCSTASDASASTTASSMPASPEKIARSTAGTGPRAKGKEVSPGPGLLPRLSSAKRMLTPITNRQQQPTSPTSPTSPPVHSSSSPPSPPGGGGGGPTANSRFPQLRSMMMLRKEVDYVPQSPVKKGAAGPGPGPATPSHRSGPATPSSSHGLAPKAAGHRKSLSASASLHVSRFALTSTSHSRGEVEADGDGVVLGSRSPPPVPPLPSQAQAQARAHHRRQHTMSGAGIGERDMDRERERERDMERNREKEKEREREFKKREGDWRTTAEKRELLGTMLGNVDALVESVSRAGIWGLG